MIQIIPKTCGDCGAQPQEFHDSGCGKERCPMCGGQIISCGCIYEYCGMPVAMLEADHPEIYSGGPTLEMYAKWDDFYIPRRMRWTGFYPGTAECREYGFWCRMTPNDGWQPCDKSHPEATEDLNRLILECDWCFVRQRFIRRSPMSS